MSDFELSIRRAVYSGWKQLSITSSIEQLAPSFQFEYFHQWAYGDDPVAILEGDDCEVKLEGRTCLKGYVDEATIEYSASTLSMNVSGRARTGDLCDCSAVLTASEVYNQTVLQLAQALCRPFDISARLAPGVAAGAPLPKFAIQEGEPVQEALARAARLRGLFVMTDMNGNLQLCRAGGAHTATVIQRGVNVLTGGRSGTWAERYSRYVFKSQVPTSEDEFTPDAAAQLKVHVDDQDVNRYRPLVTIADQPEPSRDELTKRARWECNTRAGKSQRLRYTVHGWTNEEGVWRPNVRVRVVDPLVRVDRELLIWSVSLERGDDGDVTRLELTDPAAADVEPLSPKPDRGSSWL